MTKLQQITITKQTFKGSNRTAWNVDVDGAPLGQIWTFKAKGEVHPFHVKTLAGFYSAFTTYEAAESAIRGQA